MLGTVEKGLQLEERPVGATPLAAHDQAAEPVRRRVVQSTARLLDQLAGGVAAIENRLAFKFLKTQQALTPSP